MALLLNKFRLDKKRERLLSFKLSITSTNFTLRKKTKYFYRVIKKGKYILYINREAPINMNYYKFSRIHI